MRTLSRKVITVSKPFVLTSLVLLAVSFAWAQKAARQATADPAGIGNLDNVAVNGATLLLRAGQDTLTVQVVEPNVLHVHYHPNGETSEPTAVLDPHLTWRNETSATIKTDTDPITISTAAMTVDITKSPVRITVEDHASQALLVEPTSGGVYAGGLRFQSTMDGPFFGIDATAIPGENMDARQDIRTGVVREGGKVRAGQQGDGGAPLIYTPRYGLLVDSDGGNFNINEDTGALNFTDSSRKDVEYFVVVGDPMTTMHAVADITGHAPMMPKWTLGFMNSQWGTTEAAVKDIIKTYRAKEIPIDGFILDFDWKAWGEDNYGEWRWNSTSGPGNVSPDKYPDGASGKFAQEMRDEGIKLVGILKPRILLRNVQGNLTDAAKYAQDHHFFFAWEKPYPEYFSNRPARDIDFSIPAARAWFWEHFIPTYRAGIQYFWNDEADSISDLMFPNLQFEDMERAMYEGARSISDQRVWSINRNFFLGAQRYAYGEWSGDIDTGFASMAQQEPRMLSTISLGEPHWSMDTGGFHGHPSPENYARWMEFAAFVPIMRVHGDLNEHRQPWVYGPQAAADAKAAIDLRYRLMPYMYAYERQAHETGVGIVRPLFWEFPEDSRNTVQITDEWMFGDDLLAAPIVHEGQEHRSIYLPPGEWTDYFRGQWYPGGKTITYTVDPHTWSDIPLFVRDGAIIPTENVEQYVGQHPVTRVYVDVFPAAVPSEFTYYDDDGITYAYEKGVFYKQQLSASDDGTVVHFDSAAPTGTYVPALREYEVKLHGFAARTVTVGGTSAKRYDNIAQLDSAGGEGWSTGADQYGAVTVVMIPAKTAESIAATR
ncbi:MAG TPA: TIM-barrel domain-containing protein [Candidatus Acidoferrum sp.]|nr:TIM-barrel domain-containing protein [Candidatus Acidoferrum sp.]